VADLAGAFNDMAAHLEATQGKLHERNVELAQSVVMLEHGMRQQKEAAERIEYLAFHDSLTALANRAHFSSLLKLTLERAKRTGGKFALLFIDLDRFKQINDTIGHETGDLLLQEVAQRLKTSLRASDVIARLGGDEFVVMIDSLKDDAQAETVARKIHDAIAKPFVTQGHELRVSASIGISRFVQDGADEQTLMKNADIAMYQAKGSGRNGFAFYSVELNRNSFERLAMETALRRAIDVEEFLLHYQPKQDLQSGTISGMEALLRWQHPDLGMVSPAQFIPIAEETGLIVPIGKWVLRKACQQYVAWSAEGMGGLTLAVNLSPRQFADDNLLNDITATLAETRMQPRCLELEITEGAIMQDLAEGQQLMLALKAMGVRIAVDDFGTGYSSLATVKQFPIDTLKIDRAFVRDLGTDAGDRGITRAIIAMASTLNLRVVAEGVELAEQHDFLRENGCGEIQGYLFSRPLATQDFFHFVQEQEVKKVADKLMRLVMERGTARPVAASPRTV
jgi:diguanylate cyclase (GGDEF)-like protein